jgi:hypothetical protein
MVQFVENDGVLDLDPDYVENFEKNLVKMQDEVAPGE